MKCLCGYEFENDEFETLSSINEYDRCFVRCHLCYRKYHIEFYWRPSMFSMNFKPYSKIIQIIEPNFWYKILRLIKGV